MRFEHGGDTGEFGSVGHSEPEYLCGRTGKVGAQQRDFFSRLNLQRLWYRDPTWKTKENKQTQTRSNRILINRISWFCGVNELLYLLRLQTSKTVRESKFLIVHTMPLKWCSTSSYKVIWRGVVFGICMCCTIHLWKNNHAPPESLTLTVNQETKIVIVRM